MDIQYRDTPENFNNTLKVNYNMGINGYDFKQFDLLKYIDSISLKETVEGADTATVIVSDPEFRFISDNLFIDEASVWITLYWNSTTDTIEFKGYISAIDINFQDSGIPQLTITCMDRTAHMNKRRDSRTFYGCTSAEIVTSLVSWYGLNPIIDSDYEFTIQESITQSNQTDIEFITKMASDEVHPFTARIVGDNFYYERIGKLTVPKISLTYGAYPYDLISFAPQINKESKQVEIKNSSIDTGSKEVSNTTATVIPDTEVTENIGTANSKVTDNDSPNSSIGYTYDPTKKGQPDRWKKVDL